MITEYLLVHKSMLPECFSQVIECRELVDANKMSVSDACKKTGISRSTFYKYKDYVFNASTESGSKAILSLRVMDKEGVLGHILNTISINHGNVITINQDVPIKNTAYINICLSTCDMDIQISELVKEIAKLEGVKLVELLAVE